MKFFGSIIISLFASQFCLLVVGEEERFYSFVRVNLSGEGYAIVAGNAVFPVSLSFVNDTDEWAFTALRDEIVFASASIVEVAPVLHCYGKLDTVSNHLEIRRWFVLSPFVEINSITEVDFDKSKTKLRYKLTKNDFRKSVFLSLGGESRDFEMPRDFDPSRYVGEVTLFDRRSQPEAILEPAPSEN